MSNLETKSRVESGNDSRASPPKRSALSMDGYIAIFTALGIAAYPISRAEGPLILVLLVGGLPLLMRLVGRLLRLQFGSDLLAGVAIVASALVGEYLVGSIIVLMLSGGAALEHYATRRASSVLEALAARVPQVAHR